jgi:hypothetical protein
MLVERKIEASWVELAIREPEAVEPDPLRPGVLLAFRRVPERGGRFLRVVYVQDSNLIRVLTAFFDRNRMRSQQPSRAGGRPPR